MFRVVPCFIRGEILGVFWHRDTLWTSRFHSEGWQLRLDFTTLMGNVTGLRKDKNPTASALFGVAAIQILITTIGFSLYNGEMGVFDRIITFSGLIYVVLGFAARWVRLPAAAIGALLYASFLSYQAYLSSDLLMAGLIFKVPIVILLVLAITSALRRPALA